MPFKTRVDVSNFSSIPSRFDVVFVLPHMGRGGAQRVTSIFANAWARQGKKICIATWDGQEEVSHDLDTKVVRIDVPTFARELALRSGLIGRWKMRLRDGLHEAWRWRRSRRQIRRLAHDVKRTQDGKIQIQPNLFDAARNIYSRRQPWWSMRRIRHVIGLGMLWLDRNRQPLVLDLIFSVGRGLFSRLVLGYRVDSFRQSLRQLDPAVVVSLLTKTNLYVLEAMRREDMRVVISERNDPELQEIDAGLATLRRLIYREAYAVTSNSAGVLEKLAVYVPPDKLKLLPNPIIAPASKIFDEPRKNQFVTVARLIHQKGIDLLLEAFARIADDVQGWHLEIVGDGPLRAQLVAQAKDLGIANRITFHGHVSDPITILRSSRVFVLPSRFEGMPNALLEAMACKLAPIVTDASPGPLESVRHNESGLVVSSEDVAALAGAMRLLASDDEMLDRLAEQAGVYVRDHDWSVVESQWHQVLGIDSDSRPVRLPVQVLGGL